MATSISFRIVNWKLTLLALIMVAGLCRLGFWQLSRAEEKRVLIAAFSARTLHEPLVANDLNTTPDPRYYRIQLFGHFDNAHNLLLDNKIVNGKVGYEVYTPFIAKDLSDTIIVDRGFIPMGVSRQDLPSINSIQGEVSILGMLNSPPKYVAFGPMEADANKHWPMRIEYLDLNNMKFNSKLYPYVIILDKNNPAAYQIQWQAFETMPPERHIGYAVQWFALALTLLILCVVLNRNHQRCTLDE